MARPIYCSVVTTIASNIVGHLSYKVLSKLNEFIYFYIFLNYKKTINRYVIF